jgi:hypothetical protein
VLGSARPIVSLRLIVHPCVYFRIRGDNLDAQGMTTIVFPCSVFFDPDKPTELVNNPLEVLFLKAALDLMASSSHFKDAARKSTSLALTSDPTLINLVEPSAPNLPLLMPHIRSMLLAMTPAIPTAPQSLVFAVDFGRLTPAVLLKPLLTTTTEPTPPVISILRAPSTVRDPTPAELSAAAATYTSQNDAFPSGFVSTTSPTGIQTLHAAPAPFPGIHPSVANLDKPAARTPYGTLYTGATPDRRATFRTAYSPGPDHPRTVRFPHETAEHPPSSLPSTSPSSAASSQSSIPPLIDEWIEIRPGEVLNPKTTFDSIKAAQSGDLRYVPDHTLTSGVINLLDPWKGYCNGHLVLCFPVKLPRQFLSLTDYFDSHFSFRQNLQDTEKFFPTFLRRFPSFTKYNNGLLSWCRYFCPPLHTLSHSCVYGTWYQQIPQAIIDNLFRHDEFLKSAPSNTPTGLAASTIANVASAVSDLSVSGYKTIRRLLTTFGHPKLSSLDTLSVTAPVQHRDAMLEQYTILWRIHRHIQTLNHQVYSDRCIIHLFPEGLHPSCKGIFCLHVCPAITSVPAHHPLPSFCSPPPSTLTSTRFVFSLVIFNSLVNPMAPLALDLLLAPLLPLAFSHWGKVTLLLFLLILLLPSGRCHGGL